MFPYVYDTVFLKEHCYCHSKNWPLKSVYLFSVPQHLSYRYSLTDSSRPTLPVNFIRVLVFCCLPHEIIPQKLSSLNFRYTNHSCDYMLSNLYSLVRALVVLLISISFHFIYSLQLPYMKILWALSSSLPCLLRDLFVFRSLDFIICTTCSETTMPLRSAASIPGAPSSLRLPNL